MAGPALRALAVAGVLATAVLFGGFTAVPAGAQPDGSDGSSQDSGDSSSSGGDNAPAPDHPADSPSPADEGSGAADPEPDDARIAPTDTGGGGDDHSTGGGAEEHSDPPPPEPTKAEVSHSITIPMLRLPPAGSIPFGGWPTPSTFFTTFEIPAPTFQEFLAALRLVPAPSPAPLPGPAFRTQEEGPVVDAGTGTTGGGGGGSMMWEPQVLQAPLVSVPRAVTIGGAGAKPTPGGIGMPITPGATQPGVAGARTPVIRGSVSPTPGAASVPSAKPMEAGQQPARLGYPRYMRSPTVTELAVVALPGVAGLALLTFGGGLIGYRQANSGRFIRTAGADRFLP